MSAALALLALGAVAAEKSAVPSNTFVPVAVCQISSLSVVVKTEMGAACIRYAASARVQGADTVVMSLHGDRNTQKEVKRDFQAIEQERLKEAQQFADRFQVPWIMIARPGVYGSSGDHRERRELGEFLALNAAMSAIKERYGIKQLALVGHSGGATAVAAVLTLGREDIVCATMTSGAFSLLERQARRSVAHGRNYASAQRDYDPLNHVGGIRSSVIRKITVAGDPRDANTHFDLQRLFADKVKAAGHAVELVEIKGVPPHYHNVGVQGLRLAAECVRAQPKRMQ